MADNLQKIFQKAFLLIKILPKCVPEKWIDNNSELGAKQATSHYLTPSFLMHIIGMHSFRLWYVIKNCMSIAVQIDLSHKSHSALEKYFTMHHFVKEMCTNVHITVTVWHIVG